MESEKKLKEKKILFEVYDSKVNCILDQECEKPDFILKDLLKKIEFGVEVTRLYLNDSGARLKNIPMYPTEIIEHGRVRHKDDTKLRVEDLEILNPDGTTKTKIKGIIQVRPVISEYLKLFLDCITCKENKNRKYRQDLEYVNLIISDEESYFDTFDKNKFFLYFYSKEIIKKLLDSPFNEIFFISKFKDGNSYFFPLKSVLFLARYYLFSQFYPYEEFEIERYFRDFVFCLLKEGFHSIFIHKTERFLALSYGNYSIKLDPQSKENSFIAYLPDIYHSDGIKAETFLAGYTNSDIQESFFEYLSKITLNEFGIGLLVK